MARKPWDELSPTYRRRLERKGITRETHATASLKAARGKGPHTPAERARTLARRVSQHSLTAAQIMQREHKLGYIPLNVIAATIEDIGTRRMTIVLEWQEWRTNTYTSHHAVKPSRRPAWHTPEGLPDYVTSRYGDDAWDDVFEDWFDTDMQAVFNPYHATK